MDSSPGPGSPRSTTHRVLASVLLAVVLVGLWLGFSALISAAVVRTYDVPSASMAPTIGPGSRASVFLLDTAVHRGDIVVFDAPPQAEIPGVARSNLIKRAVAVGGDTVACCRADRLVVNGRRLNESFVEGSQPPFGLVKVPAGKMFVLGDNRSDSGDSKFWGPIPTGLVIGHVVAQGAAAGLLSPLALGAVFAVLVTFLAWLLGVRRTSYWRGAQRGD